jgi:hypothetical protein
MIEDEDDPIVEEVSKPLQFTLQQEIQCLFCLF